MSDKPISPLRQRMIDDMTARRFSEDTQRDYVRNVRNFTAFLGRSPDTATSDDLRRFQLHMAQRQISPWSINAAIAALRFFFTVTLERPDLVRLLRIEGRNHLVLESATVLILIDEYGAIGRAPGLRRGADADAEAADTLAGFADDACKLDTKRDREGKREASNPSFPEPPSVARRDGRAPVAIGRIFRALLRINIAARQLDACAAS